MLRTHAGEKKTFKPGRRGKSFFFDIISHLKNSTSIKCSVTVLCHVFGYTKAVFLLLKYVTFLFKNANLSSIACKANKVKKKRKRKEIKIALACHGHQGSPMHTMGQ